MGLFFISTILLVILTGPGNFFNLGQLGQRKNEQAVQAKIPLPPGPSPSPSSTPNPNIDTDGDGFNNGAENYMGTDPFAACSTNSSPSTFWLPNIDAHAAVISSPTPKLPAWPPDFDNDRAITIADIGYVSRAFGSTNPRYDLNQDGSVTIADIGIEQTYFGKTCKI